jgi:glutaredoxin
VRRLRAPALTALVLVAGLACRKQAPEAPPSGTALPALEVDLKGKWLYTYADDEGRFVTTDDLEKVPPSSRHLVRVIDPGRRAPERGDIVAVYVVNANELARSGKVTARILSREAFETGALAQLPPGESSPLPGEGAGEGDRPRAGPEDPAAATPPVARTPTGEPAVVTLYGTAWCGACKAARSYLAGRKIPFADKDVEKDPAAARELQQKARRLGISADRVPILDVRGRLLIGFDKARFEALLGEAS